MADRLRLARVDGVGRADVRGNWGPCKTVDAKLAMYNRIVERLAANPGVRPEDVLISVVETPAENWSFGSGETQFYKPAVAAL